MSAWQPIMAEPGQTSRTRIVQQPKHLQSGRDINGWDMHLLKLALGMSDM